MKKMRIAAILLGTLALTACKKEAVTIDCTNVTPTYSQQVQTILNNSCALSGCHNASTAESGVDLSTYAAAKAVGGDRISGTIQGSGYPIMPPTGSLSDASIQQLYCWVQNGMPQ
jgi:hypothetical protein